MGWRVIPALVFGVIAAGCVWSAPTTPPAASVAAPPSPLPPNSRPGPTERASPVTGTCPVGQEGLQEQSIGLDRSLRLDGETISLTTAAIRNRSGDEQADDVIPQWVGLTAETPTVAAPAGAEGILMGSPGMTLEAGTVSVFPASEFVFATNRFPDPASATASALAADGGLLTVSYPTTKGQWVLAFYFEWQTKCLTGDGVSFALAETS